MRCLMIPVIAGCVMLLWSEVFGEPWDNVIFRDDFDVSAGGMPDPDKWVVNYPDSWWWVQGRTFFASPAYHSGGPFPQVADGICTIDHHHYNPWHLGTPKTTFLGGEIHTIRKFRPDISYRFEARVKNDAEPNGMVTSFFLYGYDGAKSDEIDFEFVSNKTNDNMNFPQGDPVLANTWNESQQKPLYVEVAGLDLTEWNTFRIYWYPDPPHVEWTWLDPNDGEKLLRVETDLNYIPNEPMALYFNFWAPTSGWSEAYDKNLQPVSDPGDDEVYNYKIDYVEVRTNGPVCGDANHPFPVADLDGDCYVNLRDFDIIAAYWLRTPCLAQDACGGADLVDNNIVDLADFIFWVDQWLECTAPDSPCS